MKTKQQNTRIVTMALGVSDGDNPTTIMKDSMTIYVYDDACQAAKGVGLAPDPGDVDEDCDTDLEDFAEMAATWLVDYTLTEPAVKP